MLTELNCQGNHLTTLDLRNGNNTNFVLLNNGAQYNPGLTCISVDNPTYSITNWGILFHETAAYSANCLLSTNSNQLETLAVYPNPTNGKVFISTPESLTLDKITIADINGRIVKSIKPNEIQLQYEVDLSGLNTGIYFATIKSADSQLIKKIILR